MTKGITPKICGLCACVLINKRSFEPFTCLDLQGQQISMYTSFLTSSPRPSNVCEQCQTSLYTLAWAVSQITHRHQQEHQGYYTLNCCYALHKLTVGPQDHPALVWALSHHTDPMQHEAQGYIKITSYSDSIMYTLRGVCYLRSVELHSAAKHQVFAYYYNESVGRRRCRHHDPTIQRQIG